MISPKAKSGLSEASNGKATTATTPKLSKVYRNGPTKSDSASPSPVAKSSSPVIKLPSPVPKPSSTVPKSRSLIERSTVPIKTSITPEKPQKPSKGSGLQAKLDAIEEDLKKARGQLASVEQEKININEQLIEAKRLANETNEKLQEALVAKEKAEKSLEIEKFRADELEQVGIESVQRKEQEHKKELECIENQHSLDASALLSVTEELQKVKLELANVSNAKDTALSEADDAKKTAKLSGEKVETLCTEVSHLKSLLDSKLENMNKESAEMIEKLNAEINSLQLELERAKAVEEQLHAMEELVEKLQMEVTLAKEAGSDAHKQIGELEEAVASLKAKLERAIQSGKSAHESLEITRKKMAEYATSLQNTENEIASHREKIQSMEIEVTKYKDELKESKRNLDVSQEEAVSLRETVELVKSELKKLEEEKFQALNKEKIVASDIQRLVEEKNKLTEELKISKDEGENVNKAMEGLASALHEMSTEVRENQEKLLAKQAEIDNVHLQIEQLNSSLKNTEERYEFMLDEARYEIVCHKKTVEKYETETSNSSAEWDTKELHFINAIKKSEDELASLKVEMSKVVDSLKTAEQEAEAAKAEGAEIISKLKLSESLADVAYKAAEEAKAETLQLKERLLDKENELQNITQENDELRIRETAALQKIKELSSFLEEAAAKITDEIEKESSFLEEAAAKITDEIEKEYDLLPKLSQDLKSRERVINYLANNSDPKDDEKGSQNDEEEDSTDIMSKDLASEKHYDVDSVDDDAESKMYSGSFDQTNSMTDSMDQGALSPTKNPRQKKKKPLLHKFGNLLKKGSQKGQVEWQLNHR